MANNTKKVWAMLRQPPAIYVLAAFVSWWVFVALSGQQWLPHIKTRWDFTATGQLGDSFGILSALMTSMAAIFTYQTLIDTRDQKEAAEIAAADQKREADAARLELIEERRQSLKREEERDEENRKRDAEQTYFRLLELRLKVLEDVRTGKGDTLKIGSDAFAAFEGRISSPYWQNSDEVDHKLEYDKLYKSNVNDLGHYFRFTYHIIVFAKENFGRSAYKYIRLLRAQLSNAEIVMIALNCAFGEGQEKMAPLAERYSLFHNMDRVSRSRYKLNNFFGARAFDPDAKQGDKSPPPEDLIAVLAETGRL